MTRLVRHCLAMILMVLAVATPVAAQEATPAASPVAAGGLEGAVAWLQEQQLDSGAFAGFSGEADAGTTIDAVVALVAAEGAGVDPGTSVDAAIAYLADGEVASAYAGTGTGQAAKLVLALIAAGEDPASFSGVEPLSLVAGGQDAETGIYGTGVFDHAYAILALSAAGEEIPASAFEAIVETQAENGGWAFDGSTDPAMADSNTTAMVVQALVAAGEGDHESIPGALAYLESVVGDEGAAYAPGSEPDANSTALVAQAMIAAGQGPGALIDALAGYQTAEGALFYQAADPSPNLFSTLQGIPALAGVALPVLPADAATPVIVVR